MTLDDSTILQVNATLIVGVLIFLSISGSFFVGFGSSSPDIRQEEERDRQAVVTVVTLTPFVISSFFPIISALRARSIQSEKKYRSISLVLCLIGFVVLAYDMIALYINIL